MTIDEEIKLFDSLSNEDKVNWDAMLSIGMQLEKVCILFQTVEVNKKLEQKVAVLNVVKNQADWLLCLPGGQTVHHPASMDPPRTWRVPVMPEPRLLVFTQEEIDAGPSHDYNIEIREYRIARACPERKVAFYVDVRHEMF